MSVMCSLQLSNANDITVRDIVNDYLMSSTVRAK